MTENFHVTPKVLLSFCIPTYNRATELLPLVRRTLTSLRQDIEIVVSDNGSTDDTLRQLAEINDPRLVVISSKTNRGALFNQVNVLLEGRGSYSVLLLDKDSVDPALIPSFLEFLRSESPASGYCEYHKPIGTPARVLKQGGPALRAAAYTCHHPSGYFFRKAFLHDINIVERFTDHGYVGNFPFEFIQAELFLRGPAAIYQEPVFVPESIAAAQATKSFTINASKEDAFFTPKGRLKMVINFSNHILSLQISQREQRELVLKQFILGLYRSTFEFQRIMKNKIICEHYHIEPREVSVFELLSSAWFFYREFFQQLTHKQRGRLKFSSLNILTYLSRRFIKSIWLRLVRQF